MIRTYMGDLISRDADSMMVRLRWNLTGPVTDRTKRLRFASDFPSENCLLRGATPPTLGMIENWSNRALTGHHDTSCQVAGALLSRGSGVRFLPGAP